MRINAGDSLNTKHLRNRNVSYTSAPQETAKKASRLVVKNQSIFKKIFPVTSFTAALISSIAYLVGSAGLFYDIYNDKINGRTNTDKKSKQDHNEEGAKTVVANTKFGKDCMKFAKIGIMASAVSGIACGLGEGMPIMAMGEATNLGAGNIIETPLGTGLFGIGIASIFSCYALDNTPNLKLNPLKVLAKDSILEKSKIYLDNVKTTVKEVFKSMSHIATNFWKPIFWKETFALTPKNLIIQEITDKDGVVTIAKTLRHNKNILLHAASFVLGLGGSSLVVTSLLAKTKRGKKAQKAALKFEESGFLFDNTGMTKIGIDKLTTNSKLSGGNFALGGIINGISQIMGIDNKEGRAMQWLGIFFVFLGFSIDRGKFMREQWGNRNSREALKNIVREWKFDLSKIFTNTTEMKKVIKELKKPDSDKTKVENELISKIVKAFEPQTKGLTPKETIETRLNGVFDGNNTSSYNIEFEEKIDDITQMLKTCSDKIFSKNPELAPAK